MDSQTNRRHERKEYESEGRLQCENNSYTVIIENISLGGALISTDGISKIDLEDEIILTIPFTNQDKSVALKGRVARFIDDKVGIEFF